MDFEGRDAILMFIASINEAGVFIIILVPGTDNCWYTCTLYELSWGAWQIQITNQVGWLGCCKFAI